MSGKDCSQAPSEFERSVTQEALHLADGSSPADTANLTKVLRFCGVPYRSMTADQFLTGRPSGSRSKLLCTAGAFLHLITRLEKTSAADRFLEEHLHSVFVYGASDAAALTKLARILACDDEADIQELEQCGGDIVVSDAMDDFCGVMAGVRVATPRTNLSGKFALGITSRNVVNVISLGDGAAFLKFEYRGVPIFLSTSRAIIDLAAELKAQNFDVRNHFFSAVPPVLYIKWAFAETCWNAPETNACLVIDDPVLKSRHGFVNFQQLLSLMKRHRFSTNIAFIPWNWRRSAPEVVQLFRENPENYSLSVHGCDHTRAEFGSSDQRRLYWKTQQALERMNRHESITGIRHDRVMVFPQGIFSEAAISVLKHSGIIAAVNSDVISSDSQPRAVTISELWDIAIMGYSNFPIFTRRYPWEGIANFAFDLLLGKPAIALIHHDYCSDHYAGLIDLVKGLNALKCPLKWNSLGEVVRSSCRQREVSPDVIELEMYGTELRIKNRSARRKRYLIRRRESEPSAIKEVRVGSQETVWNFQDGHIDFEIELDPGEDRLIAIRFHDLDGNGQCEDTVSYRAKAMLRRYLCELRDNYITTTKLRFVGSVK
jgi:hypothetical protein